MEKIIFVLLISTTTANTTDIKIGILTNIPTVFDEIRVEDIPTPNVQFESFLMEQVNPTIFTRKVCKLMAEGFAGFIVHVDCVTSKALDFLARKLGIPIIMYPDQTCHMGVSPWSFMLTPSCFQINAAIADVVLNFDSQDIFIIHDASYDYHCITDIVLRLSKSAKRSRIVNNSVMKKQQLMKMLEIYNLKVLIALLSEQEVASLLKVINNRNLLSNLIVVSSSLLGAKNNFERINLIFMHLHRRANDSEIAVCHTKTTNEKSLTVQYIQYAKVIYQKAVSALIEKQILSELESFNCRTSNTPFEIGTKIMEEISQASFYYSFNTEQEISKYPKEVNIQLCRQMNNHSLEHVGDWSNLKGINLLRNDVMLGDVFRGFGGKTLVVSTVQVEPFITTETKDNQTIYSGFCFDILNELASTFNFSYKVVLPPDGQYGSPTDNGTWTGMIGMILRDEIDLAVAPFTITSIRESVIDFTIPIMEDGVGILTRKVTEEPYKIFKTLKPFSTEVWGTIGIVILTVGALLWTVNKLSPYTVDIQGVQTDTAIEQRNLKANMWLIYGSFFEQAVDPRPSATSGRVLIGFWWVFTIMMMATYTANLAAYLTVSMTVQPINSLVDLVAHDDIKPLVKAGTSLHTLFQTAKTGVYTEVWKNMASMPYVTSRADAVELTRTGEYAFMTDISQLEYIQINDCETFALADEAFNQAGLGFVMKQNAPFKNAINENIMRMHEAGMTKRWREKWWAKINSCSTASRTGGANPLGMDSLAGLFYVYLCVVGVAFLFMTGAVFRFCLCYKLRPQLTGVGNCILNTLCLKRRQS